MSTVRRSRFAVVAAVVAGAIALAGCANQQAGSAVTFDDGRITEAALADEVAAVLEAKGQPVTSADQSLPPEILGRMITIELVDRLAAREGIEVTQGQIDEQLARYEAQVGDRAAMEQTFIEQNVAPSQIVPIVTLNLQAQELGIKLLPSGSAEEQGQAVVDAVVAIGEELDTTVSPRYGTWDGPNLAVGPTPDDLSSPPALG